ncbi:rod shape-determining protein [candidate division KSB3 bacterium]|uniref:Cell shape-determining protein MreB n=1 Tax=candidate division KSB3 bacterium TaxID=2044937 RepID=A0A2G6E6D1_9BACT|nr:MAG: rod shape-determining protein [candidate division KSB3 bacterium]PIE29935.1 MAG: rod shape-determining protein [candidate division KSB3 bacterium]
MLSFFRPAAHKIAVDLGTANTLIYVPKRGILLNEPSAVAYNKKYKSIDAVGQSAKDMMGKTPEHIQIIRPLKDGVIADFTMTAVMLKYFIRTAISLGRFLHPEIVIGVPSCITSVEKKAVIDSALQAGARKVTIILEPMAAAIGAGLAVRSDTASMVVDIGGGTTDVAIIAMSAIIASSSVRSAGDGMDEAIIRHFRQKHNLLIGIKTAEHIKQLIGSAMPLPVEAVGDVRGRELTLGVPRHCRISSKEIREALGSAIRTVTEAVMKTLEKTPPEVAGDILERGIVLTGGGALLKNLDLRIHQETSLPVTVADEPLSSVVLGVGQAMCDKKLLKQIAVDY